MIYFNPPSIPGTAKLTTLFSGGNSSAKDGNLTIGTYASGSDEMTAKILFTPPRPVSAITKIYVEKWKQNSGTRYLLMKSKINSRCGVRDL